jgi:DNA-binding transcriptional LysR family regulator
MNTHDLEAFAAVVETGSIVAASARLHLTQPGVSRRVQNLEGVLGATLLDRQSKPLRPTVDGRRAYEMARRVLHSIADLRSVVSSDGEFAGDLRLGVTPFLSDQALAAPFDQVHQAFPKVALQLTADWSGALIAKVESGELDAAIVCIPDDSEPPRDLVREPLGQHPVLFIAAPRLGLPRRPYLEQLAACSWVISQNGCGLRRRISQAFEAAGLTFNVAVEALNTEFRLSLVARGVGIGLATPPGLESSPQQHTVRILDVKDFSAEARWWLVHRITTGRLLSLLEVLRIRLIEEIGRYGKRT